MATTTMATDHTVEEVAKEEEREDTTHTMATTMEGEVEEIGVTAAMEEEEESILMATTMEEEVTGAIAAMVEEGEEGESTTTITTPMVRVEGTEVTAAKKWRSQE